MNHKFISELQHRGFLPGEDGKDICLATEAGSARFQSIGPLNYEGKKPWTLGIGLPRADGLPDVYQFSVTRSERIRIIKGGCSINGTVYSEGQEIIVRVPEKVVMIFTEECGYFCEFIDEEE